MDASRKGQLGAAFVMHDSDVEALHKLLKDFGEEVVYTITCKDGISLKFVDVEKLVAFENPRNNRIVKFAAWVVNREPPRHAYMLLDSHWTQNVYLDIEGSEHMTKKLNEGLSTWLDGMRPWYWWLARGNPFTFSIVILLLCSSFFFTGWWCHRLGSALRPFSFGPILISGLVTGGSFWLLAMGLLRGFPAGVFATGQGKRRHEVHDRLRWLAIIGFPISIIASVIAAVIFGWF
jgi:hypothetical protein